MTVEEKSRIIDREAHAVDQFDLGLEFYKHTEFFLFSFYDQHPFQLFFTIGLGSG